MVQHMLQFATAPRMALWLLTSVVGVLPAVQAANAFLGTKLPLKVLTVLPSSQNGATTGLSGRSALTVVFSRPVIALGGDWSADGNNGTLPKSLTPFTLEACAGQPAFAVPGKLRWVTTSIARFDAGIDWPTDLCFELKLNSAMTSWDKLPLGSSGSWKFETTKVSMTLQSVRSAVATNLTGGRWSSKTMEEDGVSEEAQECLDDCVAYLHFTYEVDHATAYATLKGANPSLISGSEPYDECGKKCIAVRPRNVAGRQNLIFPTGGAYSKVAGLAGTQQTGKIAGIMPFKFAFFYETPPTNSWENRKLSFRRYKLYLRHGLDVSNGLDTVLAALTSAISLRDSRSTSLDFTLTRPDAATLQLECSSLQPASRYTLAVSASSAVKDGLGQTLEASSMTFDTADWPSQFVSVSDQPSRFRQFQGDWKVLSRGPGNKASNVPYSVNAWPVTAAGIKSAIAMRYNTKSLAPVGKSTVKASLRNELEVLGIDSKNLLTSDSGKGLFLQESILYPGHSLRNFVSVASFGVAFAATDAGELLVWATQFETGQPVAGAAVTVFRVDKANGVTTSDITEVAIGKTGADGTVTLQAANSLPWTVGSSRLVAIVASGTEVALEDNVPPPKTADAASTRGLLVTDRRIYRPGESVYVKGYLRGIGSDGSSYSMPKGSYSLKVQWKITAASSEQVVPLTVTSMGTVAGTLTVPANEDDVTFGDLQVQLLDKDAKGTDVAVTSASITVADPRPPTVELLMNSSQLNVLPGKAAKVSLNLTARTFSGTAVEGAQVVLTWTLTRGSAPGGSGEEQIFAGMDVLKILPTEHLGGFTTTLLHIGSGGDYNGFSGSGFGGGFGNVGTSKPSDSGAASSTGQHSMDMGTLTATTLADGMATVDIDIATLLAVTLDDGTQNPPCAEGDSLLIEARWVGPTREVVMATLPGPLRVARSAYRLEVKPSTKVDAMGGKPLPGAPFSVFLDLKDASGASVTGTATSVSLHEWDGAAKVWEDPVSMLPAGASMEDIRTAAKSSGLLPVSSWGTQVGSVCSATTDGGASSQCGSTLTLPAAKMYVVLAKATDPDGAELLVAFAVGRTAAEWAMHPLSKLDSDLVITLDKASYAVGDTASISLVSPFKDATALVMWGNGANKGSKQQSLAGAAGQQHSISFTVPESCRLGCGVLAMLIAPEQPRSTVLPIEVPVSHLLDVTAPRFVSRTVKMAVPDLGRTLEGLTIAAAAKAGSALQPGGDAEVKVTAPAGSEVCVFVVDKSMLSVGGPSKAHPMAQLDSSFKLVKGESFRVSDTRRVIISFGGYNQTVVTEQRRAQLDPWALDEWWSTHVGSSWGGTVASVDLSDEQYLATLASEATRFPAGHCPGCVSGGHSNYYSGTTAMGEIANMPPMADMLGGAGGAMDTGAGGELFDDGSFQREVEKALANLMGSGASASAEKSTSVETVEAPAAASSKAKVSLVRSDFVTTPLFAAATVVDSSGSSVLSFKLPDNIATFEVRAYAVDGDGAHKFGQASTTFISRRDVSMVPSVPRVARPGDKFQCGVSLTAPGGMPSAGVTVSTAAEAGTTGLALTDGTADASLAGSAGTGPHELTFPFSVPAAAAGGGIGDAKLSFTAKLTGAATVVDALKVSLPVKAPQGVVTMATSLALTASDPATPWAEGIKLPSAMPGSGQLALTAGVGYLPAVVRNSANLAERSLRNGQVLVSALVPAMALKLYYPGTASGDAAAAAGLEAAAKMYSTALSALSSYTVDKLGLVWRPSDASVGWYTPRASVYLNAYAIIISRLPNVLKKASRRLQDKSSTWASLEIGIPTTISNMWKSAMADEIVRQVNELRSRGCSKNCFTSWETLANVRAAYSYSWASTNKAVREEFTMSRLFSKESLDSLSVGGLAKAGLTYMLYVNAATLATQTIATGRVRDIYTRLVSRFRVQGQTAYVARSAGSAYSAGLEDNALVLLLIARAGDAHRAEFFAGDSGSTLAAKLAAYVADGAGAGRSVRFGGGRWMSDRAAAMASAALAAYDEALGSTTPELKLTATSGEISVMSYEAKGTAPPPANVSVAWEALAKPPKPLQFTAAGKGQVSLVASMTFVPSSIPELGSIYRGIFLEKTVRGMDPTSGLATGPPLQVIPLGSSVVVTIQVTTPDDLSRVTLEDLSAGGLEPVDPQVAGDTAGSETSNGCGATMGWWSWWCVPAFSYRETYADRVTWSSWATLQAGSHSVSYQAVAATRGTFTLPPASAFVEDQPEVMGISQGGTIVIESQSAGLPDPRNDAAVTTFLEARQVRRMAAVQAQECEGGCPNGGVCQLSTGKCACYNGVDYSEGDCNEETKTETPPPTPTAPPTPAPPGAPSPPPTKAPTSAPSEEKPVVASCSPREVHFVVALLTAALLSGGL